MYWGHTDGRQHTQTHKNWLLNTTVCSFVNCWCYCNNKQDNSDYDLDEYYKCRTANIHKHKPQTDWCTIPTSSQLAYKSFVITVCAPIRVGNQWIRPSSWGYSSKLNGHCVHAARLHWNCPVINAIDKVPGIYSESLSKICYQSTSNELNWTIE